MMPFFWHAIEDYTVIVDLFHKFTKIFPFSLTGEITDLNKKKGANLLRVIQPYEESALDNIELAIKNW